MNKVIKIIIKDGLGFSSGFVSNADYSCVIYCKVPDNWIDDGNLKKGKEELIFEYMYGKSWRSGNDDGSYYLITSVEIQVPDEEHVKEKIWLKDNQNDRNYRYWFYHISESEEIKNVAFSEF